MFAFEDCDFSRLNTAQVQNDDLPKKLFRIIVLSVNCCSTDTLCAKSVENRQDAHSSFFDSSQWSQRSCAAGKFHISDEINVVKQLCLLLKLT